LVTELEALTTSVSPAELARLIQVAGHADDVRRGEQTVEVVWSGPKNAQTTLRRSEQALLETIKASKSEVWVVSYVAYKIPDVRKALVDAVGRGVSVMLLLETVESSGGRLSFDGLESLNAVRAAGGRVYEWPLELRSLGGSGNPGLLHAKACVVDRQRLLISSANLTENAFDLNMELGLLVSGGPQPARVADQLEWMKREGVITEIS